MAPSNSQSRNPPQTSSRSGSNRNGVDPRIGYSIGMVNGVPELTSRLADSRSRLPPYPPSVQAPSGSSDIFTPQATSIPIPSIVTTEASDQPARDNERDPRSSGRRRSGLTAGSNANPSSNIADTRARLPSRFPGGIPRSSAATARAAESRHLDHLSAGTVRTPVPIRGRPLVGNHQTSRERPQRGDRGTPRGSAREPAPKSTRGASLTARGGHKKSTSLAIVPENESSNIKNAAGTTGKTPGRARASTVGDLASMVVRGGAFRREKGGIGVATQVGLHSTINSRLPGNTGKGIGQNVAIASGAGRIREQSKTRTSANGNN